MRRYLYGIFLKMVFVFCCILFCEGVQAETAAENRTEVCALPEQRRQEDTREHYGADAAENFCEWRYIRIYINERFDVTVDLLIVAGILAILLLAVVRRK